MGGTEWDKSNVVQRWWVGGNREYTELYDSLGRQVGRTMNGMLIERYVYDAQGRINERWTYPLTPIGELPIPTIVQKTNWAEIDPKTGEPKAISTFRKELPQNELQAAMAAAGELLTSYTRKL
jgi:YD repeat-containing protein